jgi:hypothetical protein
MLVVGLEALVALPVELVGVYDGKPIYSMLFRWGRWRVIVEVRISKTGGFFCSIRIVWVILHIR